MSYQIILELRIDRCVSVTRIDHLDMSQYFGGCTGECSLTDLPTRIATTASEAAIAAVTAFSR